MFLGLDRFFFRGKSWRVFSTKKNNLGTPDSGFKDQGIPPKCRNNLGLGFIEYFLAGGNSNIFGIFIPKIGDDFQFDSYFSNGLKPPTRRCMQGTLLSCRLKSNKFAE